MYLRHVVKEDVVGLGNRLDMGKEGERGIKDETKASGLLDGMMMLTDVVRVQGEEGLGGKAMGLALTMLCFRQQQ